MGQLFSAATNAAMQTHPVHRIVCDKYWRAFGPVKVYEELGCISPPGNCFFHEMTSDFVPEAINSCKSFPLPGI